LLIPPLSGLSLGSNGVIIASGPGDPNQISNDDGNGSLQRATVGSLFLRTDAPSSSTSLYSKTGATVSGGTGTWTAV
jgi:hypothetical protein